MMQRRDERGFTLMELMVVIVIVAILAAVAVPLYINYVKDAQRTEAKGAIGAIITAQQTHYQRYSSYLNYTNSQFTTPPTKDEDRLNCDIADAQKNWTFTCTATAGDPSATPPTKDTFKVVAQGVDPGPCKGLTVTYELNGTPSQWTDN